MTREEIKIVLPPLCGIFLEPIWIDSVYWPDLACEIRSIDISLQEDILLNAIIIDRVISTNSLSDSGINNGDVIHVLFVQSINK